MAEKQTPVSFDDWASAGGGVAPAKTGFGARMGDLGLSALKGAVAIPEAAVGVADMVTGGKAGKKAEELGMRFRDAKNMLDSYKSDAAKDAQWRFENADGFTGKLGAAVENPSLIANAVAESLPLMGAGGLVGRGLMAAAPRIGSAVATGAGEGIVGAGSAAEGIRQETTDGELTAKQAALAGATGLATGALGYGGSRIAKTLGVGDIDTAFVKGSTDVAARTGKEAPGMLSSMARGAVSEGVFEELPQSLSEQALQNVALDKEWTKDLDAAAAMGLVTGGAMGGGMGLVGRQKPSTPPATEPNAVDPPIGAQPTDGGLSLVPKGDATTPTDTTSTATDAELIAQQQAGLQRTYDPRAGVGPAVPLDLKQEFLGDVPYQDVTTGQRAAWGIPAGMGIAPDVKAQPEQPAKPFGQNFVMPGDAGFVESPVQRPSVAMGLNPLAGPLSASAVVAVDSGASPAVAGGFGVRRAGEPVDVQPISGSAEQIGTPRRLGESPIIDVQARENKDQQAIGGPATQIGMTPRIEFNQPQGKLNGPQADQTVQATPQQQGTPAAPSATTASANAMPAAKGLGTSSAPAVQGVPVPDVQVQQAAPASVTGPTADIRARNLATLKAKMLAGRKHQAAPAISQPGQAPQAVGAQPASPAAGVPTTRNASVEAVGLSDQLEDALFKERDATTSAIENDWMNGNGRRRQTNIERAVHDAVTASTLDADSAAQIIETALENDRPDLAQYAASRAMRAAESMGTTPGVPQSSPKYGKIKSDLEASKKQALDAASALQEIVNSKQAPKAEVTPPNRENNPAQSGSYPAQSTPEARQRNLATLKQRMMAGRKQPDAQAVGVAAMPAATQQMMVTFGGKSYPVDSVTEAQDKWVQFRDTTGAGVSEVGNGVRVTDKDGKFVARISYNGRAWDTEDDGKGGGRVIAEAPDAGATPMGADELPSQGATNGKKETLLKADQPTGAAAMVSGAPVADTSLNRDSSWVIREKATGKVVMETFDRAKVDALNTAKYEAVPIQQHLAEQGSKKPFDTTKPGGFTEKAMKAAGKVAPAPVAAQQTAAEAPAKKNATQTADATSKPDGVAGDAASRPTTHTNPVEYVAKLNREIPAKAPDEKPTPDTLRAAASIPTFQGGKTKMARAITEKVRQYWGGNASKIDTIIDYFGGSGSWGAYMAGAAFPNVKRLVIHEFNPDRLNKIRLFNDRGGDVEKLLSVPEVKAYFDAVSSAIDKKSTFSGSAIANVVADSNSRLKLRIAARDAVGADVFDGLLQAIQDQGNASFGKYGKGKSGSDAVDDMLRRITSNAGQAYAQMQSLRERGASIEYVTGNSYEAKQTPGKNVLAMVDPPYYATKGYNGVSLVGIDTYNDTRKLLDRLKSAGNSVIYTDEAWWEKHDKNTGRTIVPPDAGKQVDGLDAFGQLSSIKGLMGDFFRMPIATRMEVVGFIDGNRNAGTIGRSSSADDRQAQRAWQAGEDAGGLVAGTGRQAGGGMAERDGRVSEGQPAKPGRLNPSTGAGKADARNAALTSVVRNGGNSTAVLTDIAKNSTNPAFKLVAKAILAKGLPFDLRIRTDFTDGKVAHYSTGGHFVEFDPSMPFNLEQVLLHEAVHAVTSKYVASFGDSTALGKELAALFKLAEQHAKKTGAKFYGLTNADEFLAEVMTNADFAQWLDTVPVPLQKSALSRFVRAVARFFGIQKVDGATTQAMDVFERIMLAQSDLQAEASQKLSTSKDAAAVARANANRMARGDGRTGDGAVRNSKQPTPDVVSPVFSRTRPVFSRAAQGQASTVVQGIVDTITARWANAPKVVVAFDMNDPAIPERVRQEDQRQRSGGATGTPEGFYYKGTVYLMSSKLANPRDVVRVLLHESLGHFGLRGVFGKELKPLLQQIATMRKSQVEAKMKEYGLRGVSNVDRLVAAEEVLAEMAQSSPQIGLVRRAVATIKAWLRKNIPGFMGMNMSDDEIITSFIMPARNYVVNGGPNGGSGGGVRFQRGTTEPMPENKAPGPQGDAQQGAVQGNAVTRSLLDIAGWRGMPEFQSDGDSTVLFHGGSDGYLPVVKDMSGSIYAMWPGLFASENVNSAHGPGQGGDITAFRVDNGKMALDFDGIDEGEIRTKLLEIADRKVERAILEDEDLFDEVWRYVVEDAGVTSSANDRLADAFGMDADTGEVGWLMQSMRGQLGAAFGFDAITMQDEHGTSWYISPGVKSIPLPQQNEQSTPTSQGVRFSRTMGEAMNAGVNNVKAFDVTGATSDQWDGPLPSKWDDYVFKLQDKLVDLKRVTQSITKWSGKLADDINVYLQEELYHGRTAKRVQDFTRMELEPALKQLAAQGFQLADLEEYMHARHAKEANRVIAERNPDVEGLQDGGSGMKDAEADAYFAKLTPSDRIKLVAVAAKFDAIMAETNRLMVEYELEPQSAIDSWGTMFKHYVPLHREDKAGGRGTGQGFSIKGRETKGRTGSKRKVVDIISHIAQARENTVVRGEKNRVSQALVGLVTAHPNQDFWKVGPPDSERVFNPKTGVVEERVNPLFKSLPNVVMAKVAKDGMVREVAVTFNEDDERAIRMAGALKNLDTPQIEGWLGTVAKMTRYFSSINTQYNPVFGVVNLVRDVQGAMINLGATELADKKTQVAKDAIMALTGIYRDIRITRNGGTASSEWSKLYEQFQQDGGQTGFRDLFSTPADRTDALNDLINPEAWSKSGLGKFFTADGRLIKPMNQIRKGSSVVFDWLSDYNEAMENGVRLAAYKAALDKGMTRQQAASLAKNLTVNFNRKGISGAQAGAVYAFFNAAMQGTARLGETLMTMEPGQPKTLRLTPFGKKVVYGGVLLGSIQALALAAGGFGDDEPPDFVRERSLIIPTGDKTYINIPMPLGLHVIPNIGRIATEFALSGFKNPAQRMASLAGLFADSFNPIGNAGLSMQTIAPTVLDPLVALTENKDWTGKPIARASSNKDLPGYTQHKDSASMVSKFLAEAINTLSGGNQYVAGVLSPTPDQIDYLAGQLGGGVWRELSKVEQTVTNTVTGEETPMYKIPLVGRFVGSAAGQSGEGNAFHANAAKLNRLETEIKGLMKDGKAEEAQALRASNPESRLIIGFNMAERRIQNMRKEKSDLIKSGADAERVKAVEQRITSVMSNMNQMLATATSSAQTQ